MTINLYKVTEDRRALTKTVGTESTTVATLSAVIKDDCSIIRPVLEVAYQNDIFSANYMYISEFGRYYYIDNFELGPQRIWIEAHVDVLMSFKADILKLNCIIERQQSQKKSNLYLPDGMFRATARQIISTPCKFDQAFSKSQSIVITTGGQS